MKGIGLGSQNIRNVHTIIQHISTLVILIWESIPTYISLMVDGSRRVFPRVPRALRPTLPSKTARVVELLSVCKLTRIPVGTIFLHMFNTGDIIAGGTIFYIPNLVHKLYFAGIYILLISNINKNTWQRRPMQGLMTFLMCVILLMGF